MKGKTMPSGDWFHVVLTYYGNWLPGDPRGFRTRHHRLHVEGDYKHPPPKGTHLPILHRSKLLLKQPKIILAPAQQGIIGFAFLESLASLGHQALTLAVSSTHLHLQVKIPPDVVRLHCGKAKKHAWHCLNKQGWQGKLWAKGGKYQPILHYSHHKNTRAYILNHALEKAWVWKWTNSGGEVVNISS